MFEAGKKYKYEERELIVECVYASDKKAIVKHLAESKCLSTAARAGEELFWDQSSALYWTEYKEPVVKKITKCFVKSRHEDYIYCVERHTDEDLAGRIEATFTDGKLTHVRVI